MYDFCSFLKSFGLTGLRLLKIPWCSFINWLNGNGLRAQFEASLSSLGHTSAPYSAFCAVLVLLIAFDEVFRYGLDPTFITRAAALRVPVTDRRRLMRSLRIFSGDNSSHRKSGCSPPPSHSAVELSTTVSAPIKLQVIGPSVESNGTVNELVPLTKSWFVSFGATSRKVSSGRTTWSEPCSMLFSLRSSSTVPGVR